MGTVVAVIIVLAVILAALVVAFYTVGKGDGKFTLDIGNSTPRAAGGVDTSAGTGFKTRITGLGVAAGAVIGVLLTKLWSMQLVSVDDYAKKAESNRTRTIRLSAPRGRILDRNGVELVTNRSSLTVVAKADVLNDQIEMRILGNLIGMPLMAVKRKIEDTSAGVQNERTVAVDVSRRVIAYIEEHPHVFGGVSIEQRTQRYYPHGSLAAHVLGYTGAITSDRLKSISKDDSTGIDYELGDIVGQSGIEYQYESVLQGIKGQRTVYVNADGKVLKNAGFVEAQSGSDVVLTLDATIQKAAEESLVSNIDRLVSIGRTECRGGCCIAMDVTNGEVLALASHPTYFPNVFVGGISTDDWNALSSESSNNPLLNRAIAGQYPSASTIKPINVFAALNYGIATMNTTYNCTGYWDGFGSGAGMYCWNRKGHGEMNLQTGITYSCDVVFYEIGKGFFYSNDPEGMQATMRKWGLGSKQGIDLPSEAAGRVPDAQWKWDYYSYAPDADRSWRGGDCANLAIGQGDLMVTPLQMSCVYAGIARNGAVPVPHVMKSVQSVEGSGSVVEFKSAVLRTVSEDESYMSLVHTGLEDMIYKESEAQASHFTNLSVRVAGKTGSAETSTSQPHGWFIAYAPADDPKYVVTALIESGGFGSEGALNVVRDVLGAIYNEPDTSTVEVIVSQ